MEKTEERKTKEPKKVVAKLHENVRLLDLNFSQF